MTVDSALVHRPEVGIYSFAVEFRLFARVAPPSRGLLFLTSSRLKRIAVGGERSIAPLAPLAMRRPGNLHQGPRENSSAHEFPPFQSEEVLSCGPFSQHQSAVDQAHHSKL